MVMKRIVHKHPLAIRWFHWINFPVLAIMIWSGLLIYWANDIFRIGVLKVTVFHFFPNWFYDLFGLRKRLAEGMAWHFAFMWIFLINGLAYVLYTVISGQWRYLLPNRHSFREAWHVVKYDLHLTRIPPSAAKYNAAQRIAYTGIILMGGGSLVTGLAIYKLAQFSWLAALLGGYEWARFWHFWLTIGYVMFFFVHVIQVIIAGWNNFRAMITGYEVVKPGAAHGFEVASVSRAKEAV